MLAVASQDKKEEEFPFEKWSAKVGSGLVLFAWWTFRIVFIYFSVPGRGRGRGGRRWPGGPAFYQNLREGVSEEEAREGEERQGNVCGEGGGAKYFFGRPKCPPSLELLGAPAYRTLTSK